MKPAPSVFVLLVLFSGVNANATRWVDGQGQSCDMACKEVKSSPITSGTYAPNQAPFYVCSADANGEGFRGGFNLRGTSPFGTACTVGCSPIRASSPPRSSQKHLCFSGLFPCLPWRGSDQLVC
jgi:hypothetical protein